jgi:AAA ATPase-like protein
VEVWESGHRALHERERERAVLCAALRAARAGVGSLVVVEGPPGIGKTRLLAEARALADSPDLLVAFGRGAELEQTNPYGVVRQLMERSVLSVPKERRTLLLAGAARHAEQALLVGRAGAADSFAIVDGLYVFREHRSDRLSARRRRGRSRPRVRRSRSGRR